MNEVDQDGKNPLLIAALIAALIGFLAGFLGSVGSDYLNGNPINWGNAFYQGGIWGGAALATGLIAATMGVAGVAGVSLAGIGMGVGVAAAIIAHVAIIYMLIEGIDSDQDSLGNSGDESAYSAMGAG